MVHDVNNEVTVPCKLSSIRTRRKLFEILPSTLKDSKCQTTDCPAKTTAKIAKLGLFSPLSKVTARSQRKLNDGPKWLTERVGVNIIGERWNVYHDTSVGQRRNQLGILTTEKIQTIQYLKWNGFLKREKRFSSKWYLCPFSPLHRSSRRDRVMTQL